MSEYYQAEEQLTQHLFTMIDGNITVSGVAIHFYTDGYENQTEGIHLESIRDDEDGSKHHLGGKLTITLIVFTLGRTKDFHAEITRKLRTLLKASVVDGISLEGDLKAIYTLTPSIVTGTAFQNGNTEHRASVELIVRVDEQ